MIAENVQFLVQVRYRLSSLLNQNQPTEHFNDSHTVCERVLCGVSREVPHNLPQLTTTFFRCCFTVVRLSCAIELTRTREGAKISHKNSKHSLVVSLCFGFGAVFLLFLILDGVDCMNF